MSDDRIEQARKVYQQAVFSGDTSALVDAERGLDAVEAETALARGLLLHARFQSASADVDTSPAEDPAELPLFERALELYRALGDPRGEAEALFWVGCVHQFIRRDNDTAVPYLQRSAELAAQTGDKPTWSEALRHLGIAAHATGRLDEARERLEESSRLRRDVGALSGVASNMVGLAYIAAAQDRRADALATLDEAYHRQRAWCPRHRAAHRGGENAGLSGGTAGRRDEPRRRGLPGPSRRHRTAPLVGSGQILARRGLPPRRITAWR